MRVLTWLLSHAAGLAVATWWLEGLSFTGPTAGTEEITEKIGPLLGVAVVLGLVSLIVEPVARLLSLPLIVLTVGLFLLVLNALMLMLTGWIAGEIGLGFTVDGFWWALVGSVVITLVSWAVNLLVED